MNYVATAVVQIQKSKRNREEKSQENIGFYDEAPRDKIKIRVEFATKICLNSDSDIRF